jgi:predicted dehydrogenase
VTIARIAVIGTGVIGLRHISVLASDPRAFRLVAVADPLPKAESIAKEHGTEWYADYEKMLDDAKPDAVVVATPNRLHVAMALACIERGVPVLVEKPIADTIDEALSIVDASRRTGVPVLVGHHRRHNPLMLRARQHIEEGGLGQLVAVTAYSLRRKHDAYFDVPWKRQPGGGPLLINGIHEIDNLRMLCGEIDAVSAITSNAARRFEVEDTFAATLKFRNGMLGTLVVSDAVQAPWAWELTSREEPEFAWDSENSCLICGTKASLAIPSLDRWHNEKGGGRGDPSVRSRLYFRPADPMREELLHFGRVARREEVPAVSAEDATRTLACVLAIERSARTRGWVDVAEALPR